VTYTVKEIYLTLQGEGMNTGRPAVLCRFTGCNLWSGREIDRAQATCRFCDTNFVGVDGPGGGKFQHSEDLADAVWRTWRQEANPAPFVVLTGGEPLLQVDEELTGALHDRGFEIAVETNGTCDAPAGLDWICVSPKARAPLKLRSGNELKLVFPQSGLSPSEFEHLAFEHFLLQPMDGPRLDQNLAAATRYCLDHPDWELSLQAHKLWGIP